MPLSQAQGLDPLIAALRSPDAATRAEVRTILEDLTGQHLGEDFQRWTLWWEAHKHESLAKPRPHLASPPELTPDQDAARRVSMGIPPVLYEKYKRFYDLQRLYQPQEQWTPPSPLLNLIGPLVALLILGLVLYRIYVLANLGNIVNLGAPR